MSSVRGLDVDDEQRRALEAIVRSRTASQRAVRQAKALLMSADGRSAAEIARACRTTAETVRRWRRSFEASGLGMVGRIAPGRGRKPTVRPEVVERIVHDTLNTRPDRGRAWSTRSMARRHGVSKDTVARIWREHQLTPGRGAGGAAGRGRGAVVVDLDARRLPPPQEELAGGDVAQG